MGPGEYSYSTDDRSVLLPYLQRWLWRPLLERLPRSLHPNSITIFGCLMEFVSVAFVMLGLYGMRWAFLPAGVCLFVYITADNIDGAHARRTGQSHPIGEFLDHWLDLFNGALMMLTFFAVIQLAGLGYVLLLATCCLAFFAAVFEQFHRGILVHGKVGSIEAAFLLLLSFAVYFFFGPEWVRFEPSAFNFGTMLVLVCVVGLPVTLIAPLVRVRAHLVELIPPAGTLALLSFWYLGGSIGWFSAGILISLSNVVFSGRVLRRRLLGGRFARGNIASGLLLSVPVAIVTIMDPAPHWHMVVACVLLAVMLTMAGRDLLLVLERFEIFRLGILRRPR